MTALVGLAAADAACKDRLDLVDAAFDHRRQALDELRTHYCPTCPIEAACFTAGMAEPRVAGGGGGMWCGASANQRTRAVNRRRQRHLEEK